MRTNAHTRAGVKLVVVKFDVEAIRAQFPSLQTGLAHFDGPGGTQTPVSVGQAIFDTITGPLSNRGSNTQSERNAEHAVVTARQAGADLLAADPGGIVFGRSATALAFDIARTLAEGWGPGDEIVVSRLDHDSNIRPWVRYAERAGATVRWVDFDASTGEVAVAAVRDAVKDRTKLVAMTAASNILGTKPDLAAISNIVHDAGALFYVDGVANTAHGLVDVAATGADFYACSPYKFFGPHIGMLAAKPELLETLHPDKLLPSTEKVPERFELGTLPYELLAGVTAAIDFMSSMDADATGSRRERLAASLAAAGEHEHALDQRLRQGLESFDRVKLYSNAAQKTPTQFFTVEGMAPADVAVALLEVNVQAPAHSFYAIEACEFLGLGEAGAVRAGMAPYNTTDEVDRLLNRLNDLVQA